MMMSTIAGMHPSLARLLRLARQATATTPHPVQTLPQLRELLDVSPQVMNAWKNRGVSKQGAIAAARVLGCTANAILDDTEASTNWMLPQQSNGGLSIPPVAQELSLRPYILAPVIEWEQVMKAKTLPSEFEVVLVDDAMAPVAPKGTKARFSTKRQAGPGDAVLVTDDSGTLYFRVFHAGLHGEWEARPANSFFASLHSKQHGLRVVGVFVGLQASWAQLAR